ncbi:MAG: bifunctional oligoribonuclease/PAP phosphatase NrnA [Firmicutes bacterium]|nr:bifunctional oligoribonuclease/PAP phosphatase NrnA [Bacillota bacterium]
MAQDYRKMIEFLETQDNMLICGHEQPDGDCLGSMTGLYLAFDGPRKNWRMVMSDPVPQNMTFLPAIDKAISPEDIDIPVEAVLMLDGSGLHRTGQWLAPYLPGRKVYCIDHHLSRSFDGDYRVLEPEASATAEIIAAIVGDAGIEMTADIATCLYSGIAGDTGCFRFLNTTQRSLRQAAQMLPFVDLEEIRIHLFEDCTMSNLQMKGYCCQNLRMEAEGRICYAVMDKETMVRLGGDINDTQGIVNYTLMPHGVQLGVFFEEHDDFVKVSFRSRKGYNACDLAHALGGGGHELAAGARIWEPLEKAVPMVINAAKEQFAK